MFSQTTKATYQLETNFSKEQLNDEYIGNYMNAIKDVAHYVEYNLVFNDSIANFYLIEKNVADENYVNAVNFTGGNSKRFYDKNFCYNVWGQQEILLVLDIEYNQHAHLHRNHSQSLLAGIVTQSPRRKHRTRSH